MNDPRERLFRRFEDLGIDTAAVPYPAHQTVEEGKALRGDMAGTFTKNLLLKDKKGRLFLIVAHEDQNLDLKTLHKRVGATGRMGFVSADLVQSVLGVMPGALTPLAVLNDDRRLVTVVIEASLMDAHQLNFHPLVNTQSIGLEPAELLVFITSCGRDAVTTEFGGLAGAGPLE